MGIHHGQISPTYGKLSCLKVSGCEVLSAFKNESTQGTASQLLLAVPYSMGVLLGTA